MDLVWTCWVVGAAAMLLLLVLLLGRAYLYQGAALGRRAEAEGVF